MEFHEKLQELRKQKNLTQEELSEILFVSRTAISKWESGRGYPSIDSLKAIAEFFGVTIDELLSNGELICIAEKDSHQKTQHIICAENPAFERSTFDSWDFFIWGNLSDLEMLLQKPVENENDGYISKDLLKGLLVRIQDQIQIFRQTIPYFVTDRSSEMPIRIIICEL